jgi:hypothetical protein
MDLLFRFFHVPRKRDVGGKRWEGSFLLIFLREMRNLLDCGSNICSFKGLSHANLKAFPRLRCSVNGFEIRIHLSDLHKIYKDKEGKSFYNTCKDRQPQQ